MNITKRRWRTAIGAIAIAGSAAVVLAGCSAPKASTISEKTSLSIAQNSAVTSLNPLVSNQYSTYNSNVAYLTSALGFNYYDNTPKLVKNTDFGTYTKESSNPLKIKYTLSSNAQWSDGDPVNAADILLQWASSISKYNNAKGGINFNSVNAGSGLDGITKVPTVSNNGKTVVTTFDKPYVDWEQSLLAPTLPAHIVYQEAFPNKKVSNADADKAVIKAIQDNDTATIGAMAKVWSTKWNVTSMPSDKKLLVTDGPYQVTGFVKNQYITLAKNPNYKGGPTPQVDNLTVRFIADPTAQVQALQNGEVDIISGQATTDTLAAIKKLNTVNYSNSAEASYEHVDLTFNNGGPFDPKTYGGDATKAQEVREAFLKVIPRQEILDKLIKPLNPSAKLDDSTQFLPGSTGYDQTVQQNGMSQLYDSVDIAGAKALLAKAGVSNLTVKFAYPNDNPRRASEFSLIQQSAAQAGITVKDVGSPGADFFQNLGNGSYDACIFAWQYTSLAYTGSQTEFQTGGSSNYQGYSNPSVDALWNKLEYSTGTAAQNRDLQMQIDKKVVGDAATVTIFQFPDVTAWSKQVANVKDNPIGVTVFWNYWQWTSQHKKSSK
ncbi:ABC transporter family substrate-binding protein [Curtobacterium ammoniigenes]|uniref:ABC transporter family substrate-binding protein n=1 Tax=Curtobacterium ammoniigenes TaxID=395387 RepID=UPI00082CF10B|nr:ABC transporter family substrate-binding protein [Curtobacterium ammoniigenes]